jgi:hypothetical protein
MTKTKNVATSFVLDHKGRNIHVEISPCSWMYPGYGLQIKLSTKEHACNAESIFDRNHEIKADEISTGALVKEAHAQAARWLEANGVAKIDQAVAKWAEASVKFDAAIKKEQKREEKARIRRLTKRQAEGYTHVVDAWIHPSSGDDYRTEACVVGEPSAADIQRILAKSRVKTDYKVTPIAEILEPAAT